MTNLRRLLLTLHVAKLKLTICNDLHSFLAKGRNCCCCWGRCGEIIQSEKFCVVTLTSDRWAKLIDYWVDNDKEMKALDHMTRRVSFRAHIGDEYYVTINSPLRVVDISRYLKESYGPSCVRVYSMGEGVSLRFDEWAHLPTIHERHPELSIGLYSSFAFSRNGREFAKTVCC